MNDCPSKQVYTDRLGRPMPVRCSEKEGHEGPHRRDTFRWTDHKKLADQFHKDER